MSRLLAAEDLDVCPDYRMFGVGEVAAGFGESPPVPGAGWLGVGQASVLVGVVNELGTLPLRLEHWDGEPPAPDGHDVEHTVCLWLPTGEVAVDQITGGGVRTNLDLSPGFYAARVVAGVGMLTPSGTWFSSGCDGRPRVWSSRRAVMSTMDTTESGSSTRP